MKIQITDKFLWDLYKFLEKAEDAVDFILSSKYRKASIILGDENPIFRMYRKEISKERFRKMIYYLKKKNYIKSKNLEGKNAVIITRKGISKALKASFKFEGKKRRKDGKWIMMIFDIPQSHRKARDLLRVILINLGYKMFQQSVWISPYDIAEKTEKLLQSYSLDGYVKIFLIEKL